MNVYLDEVWLLNTLLNYLLLVATAQVSGRIMRRLRFLLAASFGGLYAVATFLWPVLNVLVIRSLFGIFLAWMAFRGERKRGKAVTLFFLLSAALAGVFIAFDLTTEYLSWAVLLLSSGVFTLLLELVLRQATRFGKNVIKPVRITIGDRECTLRALHDTGNTLRSPSTGSPVLVAELSALRELWSPEMAQVLASTLPPQEKVARMYEQGNTRFSLLPYTAVGSSGLLLCMRSDSVSIGKMRYPRAQVALTEQSLGASYEALWGGEEDSHEFSALHICMDTANAG